jgi:hypothetical protein
MLRCRRIVSTACLALALVGCRSSHRTRRPRQPVAAAPVAADPEPPRPVARPTPPAPPPIPTRTVAPPKPAARPAPKPALAEDRSACGPEGKGPRFTVRGVAASDTLNVRISPDARSEVLGQLRPETTGVVAVGDEQKIGTSIWRKVRCGALVGWVNQRFLDPQDGTEKAAGRSM